MNNELCTRLNPDVGPVSFGDMRNELVKVNAIADLLIASHGAGPHPTLTPSEKLNEYVRLRKAQMDADEISLPQIMEIAGAAAKMFNLFTPGI